MKSLKDRKAELAAVAVGRNANHTSQAAEAARLAAALKQDLEVDFGLWPHVEVKDRTVHLRQGEGTMTIEVVAPDRYRIAGGLGGAIWPPSEADEDAMLQAVLKIITGA